MDQVTQHNTAMAGDSLSACQGLRREVGELFGLLSRFKLDGGAGAPASDARAA